MPAVVAVKRLAVPSTSVLVNVPVAEGVPAIALLTPPASMTAPVLVPLTMAASLAPVMVTVMVCAVPSAVVTVKVSLRVAAAAKACTVALLLLSV